MSPCVEGRVRIQTRLCYEPPGHCASCTTPSSGRCCALAERAAGWTRIWPGRRCRASRKTALAQSPSPGWLALLAGPGRHLLGSHRRAPHPEPTAHCSVDTVLWDRHLHLPVWLPFSHPWKGGASSPPQPPQEGPRLSGGGRCPFSPFSPGHSRSRKAELVSLCLLAVHLSCPSDSRPLQAPLPPTPPHPLNLLSLLRGLPCPLHLHEGR